MFDKVKVPYWVICLNLLLWLMAVGASHSAEVAIEFFWPVVVGLIFAAMLQHQAYYRRARERKEKRAAAVSDAT